MSLPVPPPSDSVTLHTPLDAISGVGPALLKKLHKLDLRTVEDALYHLPQRYEDRRQFRKIAQLRDGCSEVFIARVLLAGEATTQRQRRRLFEVVVGDGTGQIALKWFHYRREWMQKRFAVGTRFLVCGEVKRFGAIREIHHPELELLADDEQPEAGEVLPVYALTEGLHQRAARKIWRSLVERSAELLSSALPAAVRSRHRLLPLAAAIRSLHFPRPDGNETLESLCENARKAIVFEEFFFLQLGLAWRRRGHVLQQGLAFTVNHRYTRPLAQMLPYRLTDAQRRVLGEIKQDLMRPHPMHRLVQGDVGSGKTIIALMAALIAIENDTQVAVVAPTEILAEQHFLQFHRWMEALGLRVELLSGALTAKERREVLARIASGEAQMVVGTHAVLQEGVEFKRLGLGIIDEQHRFGVRQRGVLMKKGQNPHMLVMTATPIPRTLSMTLYGDLALSIVDELPPGRTPIRTRIVAEPARSRVYAEIRSQVALGRQAYIVYPLVEESEKVDLAAAVEAAEHLRTEVFPDLRIGLLHGKLSSQEKESIMQRFKEREIDLLIATTVVEVGVDVPNATIMVIEHAERFGLAQLHQLRGRIGRGEHPGSCFLLRSQKCSADGLKRLQVMEETCDGFRIAEADLQIRGPGDFIGVRQSGLPDLRVANLLRDGQLLELARQEAFVLVADPAFQNDAQYELVRRTLHTKWAGRLELATIG